MTTTDNPGKPCWPASAQQAIELAQRAASYGNERLRELAMEIVERAEKQARISDEDARTDPRYKVVQDQVTGGSIAQPASTLVDWEFAILHSQLKIKDALDCSRSLQNHGILITSLSQGPSKHLGWESNQEMEADQ